MSTLKEVSVVSKRYDLGKATPNLLTSGFEFLTPKIQYVSTTDQSLCLATILESQIVSMSPHDHLTLTAAL